MKRVFCFACALALLCSSFSALAVEDGVAGAGDSSAAGSAAEPVPEVTLPQPFQVEVTLVGDDPASEAISSEVMPLVSGEEIVIGAEVLDTIISLVTEIRDNTDDGGASVLSVPVYTTQELLVPSDRDPEGLSLVSALSGLVGSYTPLTYEVTTYCGNQAITTTEVVPGLAGLDWPWLFSVSLLGLCLWSFFRLLGVVLK